MKSSGKGVRIATYLVLVIALVYVLFPIIIIVLTAFRSQADLYQGPFTIPKDFNMKENFERAWNIGRIGKYAKTVLLFQSRQ